jgi:hypothetical protein
LHTHLGQEFLQWFGLLGAPIAWTVQLVLGFGVTEARCDAGSSRWGIGVDAWEITLMAAACCVVLLAEAAALSLFLATREVEHDAAAPAGRRHFFVAAASLGNVLFLAIILMSGLAAVHHTPCQQS